jgi:hypothetical protein
VQVAGSRYYNPGLGRWTARDPTGEEGGPNLLAAMANDLVIGIDPLGNTSVQPPGIGVNAPSATMLADCAVNCATHNFWAFVTNWANNAFAAPALGNLIAADCVAPSRTRGRITGATSMLSAGTSLGHCMLTCMINKIVSLPPGAGPSYSPPRVEMHFDANISWWCMGNALVALYRLDVYTKVWRPPSPADVLHDVRVGSRGLAVLSLPSTSPAYSACCSCK